MLGDFFFCELIVEDHVHLVSAKLLGCRLAAREAYYCSLRPSSQEHDCADRSAGFDTCKSAILGQIASPEVKCCIRCSTACIPFWSLFWHIFPAVLSSPVCS